MEYIQGLLLSFTDNKVMVEWVIYIVAATAGVTLAMAFYYFFSGIYSPVKAQIDKLKKQPLSATHQQEDYTTTLEHNLNKLKYLPLINNRFSGDKATRKLLIHAGYHSTNALKIFNALKLMSMLSGVTLAIVVMKFSGGISMLVTLYIFAFIIGLTYILPALILHKLADRRMKELRKFFPDALDLLIVCCEAGLGLLEAFQRVKNELEFVHPTLAHELGLVCSKVRVGLSMQQALQEFSDRTGLEDIRGLNSVIVQSLRLGTGVAETIRVYADEYRDKRLQAAEENAAKLGVKMIFPMMFCIWPSFFIVAIGPAVLKVMNVWDKAF
ncbi:TadC [Colwellia sp. MT41]|uniref:Pilus assembly protein TadC n=1 Tax=Colwellia marinimaniae TaxID=1513592 RepID=A0ABQ0MR76_9GAMM|nr:MULTISPECIES: type II secretion system F family protein [Colwellia]ALO34031.1 TadC [Colwellia sp. MT41]GAW94877.1 pilus assembly protein TadC [Colwellia marinimaniae]